MKLIIVESPSKAKIIQKYLGDDYIVKACFGHITDLSKGGKNGIGVDVGNGFKPHYAIMKDKINILEELINEASKCSEILLASDPDREGESISWHLKQMLESSGKKISRITYGEITKRAIQEAILKPRDIDLNLFKAQEARRILDRIVGFMVSPYLIEAHGKNNSAGRVQSVAARLIIDREQEINSFKPEEFWNLFAQFISDKKTFNTKLKNKLHNKIQTENIVSQIKKVQRFVVKSVVSQKKKIQPPAPFTTISLQRYMAQRYSWSPERTMIAAQSLYETGYCTYIRTDSPRCSPEAAETMRSWLRNNNYDVPKKANEYETKASAQDAHECIRPTNIADLPKDARFFSKDEQELYKAIWLYFACSQMNQAIWATLNIGISPDNDDNIIFTTSGKTLEYNGYLEMMGEISENIELPNLKQGDVISIKENGIQFEQKFTQHPPRYTDASLLKELDSKNIGRPATYAEIFKKITDRSYIEKQGASYRPTELGKQVINSLVKRFSFVEYKYSAAMEKKLDDIAAGTLDQKIMLQEFFTPFQERLNAAYKELGHTICDKCGSHMNEKTNQKDGSRFIACARFPHCKNTHSVGSR
jgi:DNA topoisomerase-1